MSDDDRALPHDLDAEAAVLSASLLAQDAYVSIAHKLTPGRFYAEAHRRIWEAIVDLDRRGQKVDVVEVAGWLRDRNRLNQVGGPAYLAQIVDATPAIEHIEQHADRLVGLARLREVIAECSRLRAEAFNATDAQEFIDSAEQTLYRIAHTDDERESVEMAQAARESWEHIKRASDRRGLPEFPTGLARLDALLSLQRQECTTIAARPGMGKTAFAVGIAVALAEQGERVAIYELEMPRDQLATRAVCARAGVDLQRVRRGFVHRDEWSQLIEAHDHLGRLPISIDDTCGPSVLHIRADARAKKAKHGSLTLVVVDYLQLMSRLDDRDRDSREQEISTNIRALKRLARELDVIVIVLSQLNREVERRPDKRPMLSDLRDSGAIEQDSDNVVFLYRPEYYDKAKTRPEDVGIAEIIVAKQRNGPTGTVRVEFEAPTATFSNIDMPEPDTQESFGWPEENPPT